MPDNPYEPPDAPIADERALAIEGTGTFEVGQCMSDAWADTWNFFPLWLGVLLVGFLAFAASLVSVVGVIFVWPVLAWGYTRFYLNMTDQCASFGDLFSGFSNYGVAFVGPLLLGIVLFVLSLVGNSIQFVGELTGSTAVAGLGLLVSWAWTFGIMVRLYFAFLYLVDRGLGPVEALQASWDCTQGMTLKLIGLLLMSGLVVLAGLLVFGIGVIPASVMSYLMWTSAYRQIAGRAQPAEAFAPPSY